MTRKGLQDREFARRERHVFAVLLENARAEIEFEVAELHDFVVHRRRARRIGLRTAAQHGMNAGEQLSRIEGLRNVVVGAKLQAKDAVDVFAARREHDDGGLVLLRAKALENFEAVLARHHQVENQCVKVLAQPKALHGLAVFAHEHLKAVLAEIAAQEVAQSGVVVDDENLGNTFGHVGMLHRIMARRGRC